MANKPKHNQSATRHEAPQGRPADRAGQSDAQAKNSNDPKRKIAGHGPAAGRAEEKVAAGVGAPNRQEQADRGQQPGARDQHGADQHRPTGDNRSARDDR